MIYSIKMDSYKIEKFLDQSDIEFHTDIFYKNELFFLILIIQQVQKHINIFLLLIKTKNIKIGLKI